MSKILVITDNEIMYPWFKKLVEKEHLSSNHRFDFRYSPQNKKFSKLYFSDESFKAINLKVDKDIEYVINNFQLVLSIHCKQIFPNKMVRAVKCINVHPGFNPYNRGYFPQVFSIINKLPAGVTIHEIDEELDHGDIIVQELINLEQFDTSESAYNKIIALEKKLLAENIEDILDIHYSVKKSLQEGNINYMRDFKNLCEINLNDKATYGEVIDHLRALTHGQYSNAYFIDSFGKKVYLKLIMELQ